MEHAGFWRRFLAYWLDSLPITLAVTIVFYVYLGFDNTLERYLERRPDDPQARPDFLEQRDWIRNISICIYLVYCSLMEASPFCGTVGKLIVGIKVVDAAGRRLSLATACSRNVAKSFSFLVLGLGCLWVAWSEQKRGWHDYLAKTFVVKRGCQPDNLATMHPDVC